MFNLETKQATECLREPTQTIIAFSMSSDASHVLLNVVKPPAIHMWRINPRDSQGRATLVRKFIGATQDRFIVRSAFGGVDENFVISGSEDSNVYIWHRHSGTLLVNLHGHKVGSGRTCVCNLQSLNSLTEQREFGFLESNEPIHGCVC